MFPNDVMMKPQTWNDILAAMVAVRDAHGWNEADSSAPQPTELVVTDIFRPMKTPAPKKTVKAKAKPLKRTLKKSAPKVKARAKAKATKTGRKPVSKANLKSRRPKSKMRKPAAKRRGKKR